MRTTAELVVATQSGDRDAFAELVLRYERAAISTAWAVLNDYHTAQDVAQDSLVIAFRKLGDLRNAQTFGTWLLTLTRREAVRHSRSTRALASIDSVAEPVNESPTPAWIQDCEDLVRAIGGLPDHEKEVVVFHYLDGHSAREVAELTSRPIGTVTKQLSRAVVRLRQCLERVSK